MGKINVLDFEIANLIAAGEVVERPSSVLKELIENSIDSGATSIVADIKRGGVALIRVSDNGCGMEPEDLPVALKRHATSKIRIKEDLDGISTLGFRGEALAAIASVSMVTIITKTATAESGSMLISEGGKITEVSEVGCADGTTVVVENLFYNVPARRKFLKKDSTEAMNCAALVEKVALSRPDISIQLLIDGEERFKTPGDNDLLNSIYAVLGKDFSSKLIKADGTANGIHVHGYIGRSDNVRKNRNLENIFINGRYVKSLTAMAAIEKAYTSYIAPEAFPTCVLFLDMNPMTVDVNVHPAKLEVKFSNEQPVFEAVYYTVKRSIEDYEYRPEMSIGAKNTTKQNWESAFVPIGEDTKGKQISIAPKATPSDNTVRSYTPSTYKSESKVIRVSSGAGEMFGSTNATKTPREHDGAMTPKSSVELLQKYATAKPLDKENQSQADTVIKSQEEKTPLAPQLHTDSSVAEDELEYKLIGEAFNCYLMVEYDGDLLVIDKHAAHERVIFEELKKECAKGGGVALQSLMLPITVVLTPDELSAAADYKEQIEKTGFEYNVLDGYVDILAIPATISISDAESLFVKMADEIVDGRGNPEITEAIRRERALYQIACKSAIKGGRVYDSSVADWLVRKVLSLPDIIVCPHGRPIAFKLTKNELDRQFERLK